MRFVKESDIKCRLIEGSSYFSISDGLYFHKCGYIKIPFMPYCLVSGRVNRLMKRDKIASEKAWDRWWLEKNRWWLEKSMNDMAGYGDD